MGDRQVDEDEVDQVVEKFADLTLVKREKLERSGGAAPDMNQGEELAQQQLCVGLHDLVLELCREMAGDELSAWHATMVLSYATMLGGDQWWWTLPDDGYAYENVTRHLYAYSFSFLTLFYFGSTTFSPGIEEKYDLI